MNIEYQNKTVVITGASGGIGAAMARRFSACGAKVAICDIADETGEALAKEIRDSGNTANYYHLDVTDRDGLFPIADRIASDFGTIDVLINNAGINTPLKGRAPIHEYLPQTWDKILSVDLDGVYNCSRAFVPYLIRTQGSVINISSIVGLVPLRLQCGFAAAKGAVAHLTKAMAIELAEDGVRVNAIAPGSTPIEAHIKETNNSGLYRDKSAADKMLVNIPMHRVGKPDDIASAAMFLASNEYAGYITGVVLPVDGGWICGFARDF